jgi:hypothetical protein
MGRLIPAGILLATLGMKKAADAEDEPAKKWLADHPK